jgi:hypothetical protein
VNLEYCFRKYLTKFFAGRIVKRDTKISSLIQHECCGKHWNNTRRRRIRIETLSEIDGFEFPSESERQELFTSLLKKETARGKAEEKLARAKRRQAEAREQEENLEARADETLRPPWEFIPEDSDDSVSDDEQDGIAQDSEIIEPEIIEATEL